MPSLSHYQEILKRKLWVIRSQGTFPSEHTLLGNYLLVLQLLRKRVQTGPPLLNPLPESTAPPHLNKPRLRRPIPEARICYGRWLSTAPRNAELPSTNRSPRLILKQKGQTGRRTGPRAAGGGEVGGGGAGDQLPCYLPSPVPPPPTRRARSGPGTPGVPSGLSAPLTQTFTPAHGRERSPLRGRRRLHLPKTENRCDLDTPRQVTRGPHASGPRPRVPAPATPHWCPQGRLT